MIARIARHDRAEEALQQALGGMPPQHVALGDDVAAHGPGLEETPGSLRLLNTQEWADRLEGAGSIPGHQPGSLVRAPIWRCTVTLHPADRDLTRGEWKQVARRLVSAAGITSPGNPAASAWMAVQHRPGRLDVIANLRRVGGRWTSARWDAARIREEIPFLTRELGLTPPARVGAARAPGAGAQPSATAGGAGTHADADVVFGLDPRLGLTATVQADAPLLVAVLESSGYHQHDQAGCFVLPQETDLAAARQRAARTQRVLQAAGHTVGVDPALWESVQDRAHTALTELAGAQRQGWQPDLLTHLVATVTDDRHGPLADLRRFAETAAAWAAGQPDGPAQDAGQRLTWIARRLHGVQQDLTTAVGSLGNGPVRSAPPPARRPLATAVPPPLTSCGTTAAQRLVHRGPRS